MSIVLVQTSLLCGCGAAEMVRAGLCARCHRRARLSRENFGGLREFVLARDGHQCQTCGELDERKLLVHHRRPGVDLPRLLITLCRKCHVKVHHTSRPGLSFASVALLRCLWREVNPRLPEQRLLLAMLAEDGEFEGEQVPLFDPVEARQDANS